MNLRFNTRITVNKAHYEARMKPRYDEAQEWLDNEVLKDCDPYVPMRTGAAVRSGQTGTNIGSGEVKYNVPYAKRIYYGAKMHFSKAKHPQATAMWFEKAKAANKPKWLNGVNKILGGGRTSG